MKTPSKGFKRVRFSLPAQRGKHICLAGSFNNWEPAATPLKWNAKTSSYCANLMLAPGRYEYKYVIDGYWCIDPYCTEWVPNRLGTLNSVLRVA
ncbi:MAG: isoamylase early set domain-containing protein [Lentisphaerae bacterium]|nr:isoamylase early set domain-containing protein [Lentisphaerota bacterium]